MRILQKERAVRNWPKLYRKGEDILLHKQSAKKYRDDQLNFLEIILVDIWFLTNSMIVPKRL